MNRRAIARGAAKNAVPECSIALTRETQPGKDEVCKKVMAIDNISRKLDEQLQSGDYYGALQMYKTLFMRTLKSEASVKQPTESIELASDAAKILVKHKQANAAAEMANMMLTVFTDYHCKVDEYTKNLIFSINDAFAAEGGFSKELASFLRNAVKWSAAEGSRKQGHPEIQLLLARAYFKGMEYKQAAKHYLHAEKPEEFAEFLLTWSKEGYPSEFDLYIARSVLQLLCLENLKDANKLFETFQIKANCSLETPLCHFIRFLLRTLERDALPLYQLLKDRYAAALTRDKSFEKYLDKIGENFYGVQPQRSGLSSLLDLFSGGLQ
uniref:Uncharacterized protein AlNc14C355G10942 n=1 Tax=Albugo laibachii Nc14 TaxID=890382 RepID=F0WXJ1_9STRA|nr:conserved hypothetical protein [Albugo laibachii Nc14]|eukprot:CCA26185.1 conserved hypothetical protein [Albugo laibachii Nc14]